MGRRLWTRRNTCPQGSAAVPIRPKAPEGRLLRFLDNTVCSFGACQTFAATQVAARRAMATGTSTADAADSTEQCYFVESVLGVRECDAKQLSVPKRRAEELDESDEDIAYQVRRLFGVSERDADRAGYDTRWVRLHDLLSTIKYETLDEVLDEYERSVHHRMKRSAQAPARAPADRRSGQRVCALAR